jgi:DNA-directed RNA polymerase subunit H (RpoH/RPB5)
MDAEVLDLIVRSRHTILEILNDRGYDVDAHKGISPEEIFRLAVSSQTLLRITAPRKPDSSAPMERAVVVYWVEGNYRAKADSELAKLKPQEGPAGPEHYNSETDELVVLLSEPFHDNFHTLAIKEYIQSKSRMSFFALKNLVSNPSKHMFVPPHRKLSDTERDAVIMALHMKSRFEFPQIKFHVDMQARVLGLVHGDVVEIRRPSETCGEYIFYRVCSV